MFVDKKPHRDTLDVDSIDMDDVEPMMHTFDKLSGDKMLDDVSAVSHISSR